VTPDSLNLVQQRRNIANEISVCLTPVGIGIGIAIDPDPDIDRDPDNEGAWVFVVPH